MRENIFASYVSLQVQGKLKTSGFQNNNFLTTIMYVTDYSSCNQRQLVREEELRNNEINF